MNSRRSAKKARAAARSVERPSSAGEDTLRRYRTELADAFDWEGAAPSEQLFGLREPRTKLILHAFFHGEL